MLFSKIKRLLYQSRLKNWLIGGIESAKNSDFFYPPNSPLLEEVEVEEIDKEMRKMRFTFTSDQSSSRSPLREGIDPFQSFDKKIEEVAAKTLSHSKSGKEEDEFTDTILPTLNQDFTTKEYQKDKPITVLHAPKPLKESCSHLSFQLSSQPTSKARMTQPAPKSSSEAANFIQIKQGLCEYSPP